MIAPLLVVSLNETEVQEAPAEGKRSVTTSAKRTFMSDPVGETPWPY